MKRPLLLTIASLFIANAALADHIGIYSDVTGSSCNLSGAAYTETTAIIHKFAVGASASRFRVDHSAATGIIIVGLAVPNPSVPVGSIETDMEVIYGSCRTGSVLVGNLQILWLSGPAGTLSVVKPQLFPTVTWFDCANLDHAATGGHATIGGSNSNCGEPTPVEASTWGLVKALYR